MNQPDQVAIRPPRDNRWKTSNEPGPSLVEAAERAAEAVGHSGLEEEVQWKNQAGNGAEDSIDSTTIFRSGDLVELFPLGRFWVSGQLCCGLMSG